MSVNITIHWEGDVRGLKEHRLSIAEFNEPLNLLLKAVQNKVSQILSDTDNPDYLASGGDKKAPAKLIDLEITEIKQGSLDIELELTTPSSEPEFTGMFSIQESTAKAIVQEIYQEARGERVNRSVRKYLGSLPTGIRQTYTATSNGHKLATCEVKTMELTDVTTPELPRLKQITCTLAGLGWEKGKEFISFRHDEISYKASATSNQIKTAISLWNEPVNIVVTGKGRSWRLLRVHKKGEAISACSPEDRLERICTDWSETLQELGK